MVILMKQTCSKVSFLALQSSKLESRTPDLWLLRRGMAVLACALGITENPWGGWAGAL